MRLFADKPLHDLIALLAEHCAHPAAKELAEEVGLRTAFLGGIATGTLPFGVDHAHQLLLGVKDATRP